MEKEENNQKKKERKELSTKAELISFAFDVGFAVMVPLVALAVLGRIGDQYFHTAPWLLLAGILISLVATSIIIYKKTKDFL